MPKKITLPCVISKGNTCKTSIKTSLCLKLQCILCKKNKNTHIEYNNFKANGVKQKKYIRVTFKKKRSKLIYDDMLGAFKIHNWNILLKMFRIHILEIQK